MLLEAVGKKAPGFWHGVGDHKAPGGAGQGLEGAQLWAWLLRRSKNLSGWLAAGSPLASSARVHHGVQERWWHVFQAP